MATPEPLSPITSSSPSGASTPTYDPEKVTSHISQAKSSSAGSDLEAGLLPRRETSGGAKPTSRVSRVFQSMRWKPKTSSGLSETEHADDNEKVEEDARTTPEYTSEARQLVRSFTQRNLTTGYEPTKSGTESPGIDRYLHDLDYVPAPELYKPSIFGALLTSKLNVLHQEAQQNKPRDFYSSFESKHGRSRSQDRPASGTSTPKVRWYDKPESNSVTNLLAQATLSTTTPGLPNTSTALPRSRQPRPKSLGSESFEGTHKRCPSTKIDDDLVDEVSDIIARRKYLTKLCGTFMKYGAPTHRLEEYLSSSARSLAIDADFMFIPGAMICTFIDHSIYANNVEIVRKSAGLDLGKLKDVFNVYKNVIHKKFTAQEGIQELDNILNAPDRHTLWFRILMFGLASVVVGPFSFNSRPIDFPPIFIMGCVLGFLQMKVVPRSEQFSNVFEVFACVVIAFVSRAIGSIKYGDGSYIFCFSGTAQSSIAMILPGFMVLNSALELQSRNLVSGSVRMVYSIIYVLFLGFGLLVGTTIFGLIKRDAVTDVTCAVPEWFQADGISYKLLYTTFVWAPLFACCVALIYNAKWRQLPVMALIAVAGHQANFWISTQLASNLQVANAIGAFVIGCLANLYSRMFHGLAAAAMLPAIYCQVPGGLAASGSLVAGVDSANQIFGNSSSISIINNGTQGFIAAQNDPSSVYGGTIFNVGYGMVQVAIGISVGLYLSALVVQILLQRVQFEISRRFLEAMSIESPVPPKYASSAPEHQPLPQATIILQSRAPLQTRQFTVASPEQPLAVSTPSVAAPPVKNILISGAAQGIGRCLTRHFLQKGHKVFILDFNEAELEHTTGVHLKSFTDAQQLGSTLCNLRSIDDIRRSADEAASFFDQRIDVLINNGGISSPFWKDNKSMDDPSTSTEWLAYVETNLTAPFHLSQAVLPYMKVSKDRAERKRQRQGSSPCVIHMSSFRMLQSDPNQEGYASTKSGLIGLTHSMAVSLSEFGIRVNLIAPGRIRVAHECRKGDEEGLQWSIEDDDAEKFAANRAGMPEDIADCAEWLIGAGFVTGQSITVDGGAMMQKR